MTPKAKDPSAGAWTRGPLRIATLNMLKGGGKRISPAQVQRDTCADLLLLQEAAGLGVMDPRKAAWIPLRPQGWGSAVWVARGHLQPLPIRDFIGWVVACAWHLPEREPIHVVSVHVPHGRGGYSARLSEILDRIADLVRSSQAREVIIGGDFNICIGRRNHEGERPRVRELEIHARLRSQFDLVSCWDALHPRRPPAQTLRWTGDPSAAYHCDGLFVPSGWTAFLRTCVVRDSPRWRARSDHNPVIASFG